MEEGRSLQNKKFVRFGFLFALVLVVSVSGGWLGAQLNRSTPSVETQKQVILDESRIISEIAEEVGPSVVSVNVTSLADGGVFGPSERQSAGTGFIISDDGVVVTNRHVVPGNDPDISLTLSDGTELDDIEVIGRTGEGDYLDVAFLKINDAEGKTLKPVKLADSTEVKIGDKVIAIGNALGQFQNTVTSGIISGYGREVDARDGTSQRIDSLQNLFQTDAAINPGNSGGPLVNIDGEVIGINTAVAGDAQNIGFAIPISDVIGLIDGVLDTGELRLPFLGVQYVALTDDLAFQYELDVKRGAYVLSSDQTGEPGIVSGSPAEKAGIKEGDIITKVNGKEIGERSGLVSLLRQHKVGQEVTLTVIRDGKEITTKATLAAAPQN